MALSAAAVLIAAPAAGAAVLPATPESFAGVFASARGGDTVELAAGDYGRFAGAAKPGLVTIRPAAGAAATMRVAFDGAANLRLEGLTIADASIRGTSRQITIAGSLFTGQAVIQTGEMVNAGIVLDGNRHPGINACSNCYEGRVQVVGRGAGPSGVTIQNSTLGPGGDADGMQIGADGVRILDNEFVGIRQVSAVHSDALQLYGQFNTLVQGNYFHDNDVAIMAPDGGTAEQIVDNVFVGGGEYRPAIQLGSHDGTVFAHNTVVDLDVFMDAKDGDGPSTNGVLRDNVLLRGAFSVPAAKCASCTVTHNLFSARPQGAAALVGTPAFAGGTSPATFAGFTLAAGSPGKGDASDGTDRGVRVAQAAPVAPPPAPPAGQPAVAAPKLGVAKRVRWSTLARRGLAVRVTLAAPARVTYRIVRGKRTLRKVTRTQPDGTTLYRVKVKRRALGRKRAQTLRVRVTVTDATGAQRELRAGVKVRR